MDGEVGKICITSSCPLRLKWHIPDLFSRLQKQENSTSPQFMFCDQKWKLRIWKYFNSSEFMTLWLSVSPLKNCNINYDVSIINGGGREFANIRKKFLLHNFITVLYHFPTPPKLQQHQDKTALSGTWTISCVLRCTCHSEESQSVTVVDDKELNEENADNSMEKENTVCSTQKEIIPAIIGTKELNYENANNAIAKEENTICSAKKEAIPVIIDSERLLRDMEALFSSGKGSDATLIVQGRRFPVHTSILRARSSVFDAMFSHDVVESTTGEVNIRDFDPDIFHDFLLYLYCAKVENLSLDNAIGLYSAADKYDAQELKTKCIEFMRHNLSLDMFCSVVSLALQHQESSLLEASTKFFVENLKEIIVTVEWHAFLKEKPTVANELLIKASDFYVSPKAKQ